MNTDEDKEYNAVMDKFLKYVVRTIIVWMCFVLFLGLVWATKMLLIAAFM